MLLRSFYQVSNNVFLGRKFLLSQCVSLDRSRARFVSSVSLCFSLCLPVCVSLSRSLALALAFSCSLSLSFSRSRSRTLSCLSQKPSPENGQLRIACVFLGVRRHTQRAQSASEKCTPENLPAFCGFGQCKAQCKAQGARAWHHFLCLQQHGRCGAPPPSRAQGGDGSQHETNPAHAGSAARI